MFGKELPRIAEIWLGSSEDGQWLLAGVKNGDGGENALYLMNPSKVWTQITHFEDKVVSVALGATGDPALYLLSRKDAPLGKVLRVSLADPVLSKAKVIVEENNPKELTERATITSIVPTQEPFRRGVSGRALSRADLHP